MLEFREYVYQGIGNRVREFRDKKNYTRQKFVSTFLSSVEEEDIGKTNPLSVQSLSNIENVNIVKRRNPYLLSKKQLDLLPEFMGCTRNELVFGDGIERENTVKLILLSIILNGAKFISDDKKYFFNPFIDMRITQEDFDDLFNDLKLRTSIEVARKKAEETIEYNLIEFKRLSEYFPDFLDHEFNDINTFEKESKHWFEQHYPFFANVKNFERIKYLMNERNPELDKASNLLIKLLIGNERFAELFMKGINMNNYNQIIPSGYIREDYKINLVDFIENYGQLGALALDFKNTGYTRFINAFNEMWARNGSIFMNYFNTKLFKVNLYSKDFKKIDDYLLHNIISSNDFSNQLYQMLEIEKYELATMRGHNILDLYLQMTKIQLEINLEEHQEHELYKYADKMIEVHNEYK